ncbi:MAG: F0F1 ATP synthase subunit epsilon [Candidatus Binatia bacterium]
MQLRVLLPTEVLVDEEVSKVVAEADSGSFCLLPRHRDIVAALIPGVLIFTTHDGSEVFLAVDNGVLVKCGANVQVSTRHAVRSSDLGSLQQTIMEQFHIVDEREKKARSATARLEADLVRRFMELGGHAH